MSILDDATVEDETRWSRNAEQVQAHYSSIMLHRKCPQAWYYRYGLELSKPKEGPGAAPHLYYGSWFGAMRTAEALVRGRAAGTLLPGTVDKKWQPIERDRQNPENVPTFDMAVVTPRDILVAAVEWHKKHIASDEVARALWDEKMGEQLPHRLKGGFERWMEEHGEARKKEEVLGVEVFWARNLPRPEADAQWDPNAAGLPQMRLIGFIDELYRDTERDIVVVRDNKTATRIDPFSPMNDMMDSQLQLYPWGITPKLHDLGIARPRAISYDRAKSTKSAEPRLNLNGSLSAATKNYDLLTYRQWAARDTRPQTLDELKEIAIKNGKRESWDDFSEIQQQIMTDLPPGQVYGKIGDFKAGDVPKFGIYEIDPALEEKLKQPDWRAMFHQRTLKPVNDQVIKAHLRAAVDTTTDIWRTQIRAEMTFETTRNLSTSACTWCDYVHLCRAQIFGGPSGEYDLREYGLKHKSGGHLLERGIIEEPEAQPEETNDQN